MEVLGFRTSESVFENKVFKEVIKLNGFLRVDSWTSQVAPVVKNPPANAGDVRDVSLIPESGRSPGGRHDNPLQFSCLENPIDRGAWPATIHRVAESDTTEAILHSQDGPLSNKTSVLIRRDLDTEGGPCEDRGRRWPSIHQGEGPQEELTP